MGATAQTAFQAKPTAADPHRYQTGFGNRFASEAIPNVLPKGRNVPQKVKYDLYSEQLNGAAVVTARDSIRHVWMYRLRPSAAHGQMSPSDENPLEVWDPLPLLEGDDDDDDDDESGGTDFVSGMRTIGGQGDPSLREGLAIHVYSANRSMANSAFCNNDGDFLILPQHGRLQIQTELGWLMVRPGELAVIQAGIRFRILLPDGPVRGYVQEIFGAHYHLPELGPVGSNGMALERDFESPVASFDVDESRWRMTYKLAGSLHACEQNHTPFDVVAWHGNLVPYKYDVEKFVNMANANKDQADPTIYCVLAAKSKTAAVSMTDFLVFTKKWITAEDTFRPPYYHRNMSTEVMGLLRGQHGGGGHRLTGGGLSYVASYMPHGETYETWKEASTKHLRSIVMGEETVAFMFHISVPLYLTKWALRGDGGRLRQKRLPEQWDGMKAHFLDHLDEVEADLQAAGLPTLADGMKR
ncbi:hypothetical protein RJ55_01800 [Drechmeria coniospora]|nr:hypothetical protein RJ55_01800 [Drechmeria coniospora]